MSCLRDFAGRWKSISQFAAVTSLQPDHEIPPIRAIMYINEYGFAKSGSAVELQLLSHTSEAKKGIATVRASGHQELVLVVEDLDCLIADLLRSC